MKVDLAKINFDFCSKIPLYQKFNYSRVIYMPQFSEFMIQRLTLIQNKLTLIFNFLNY